MHQKDREELLDEFQTYFQQVVGEELGSNVEQAYVDLLEQNLEYQVGEIPESVREDLAEIGAEMYASQARRILESDYLGEDDIELAMATAFLDSGREAELGMKTRSVFREYNGALSDLDNSRYEKRVLTVLTDPWPESHLGTGVERFKSGEEDRTFY